METNEAASGDLPEGTAILTLAPRLDTVASQALAEEMKSYSGKDLTLDAGAVEHLGAHAAQTLLSAARAWTTSGHTFAITPRSEAVDAHLATLGIVPADLMTGEAA
ncbi:MAG: chemotaxis protein CheX [Pseudomonadota bacterium]